VANQGKPKGGGRGAAAAAGVQGAQAGGPVAGAAGYVAKRREQRKDLKARQKTARAAAADQEKIRQASARGRQDARPLGSALAKFPRKALLAELVVCLVIVWGGALVAPKGPQNGTTRALVKTSGLAAVFLILALVSSAGKGAQKTASAIGGLVALAYLFTSSDALELAKWVAAFWSKDGVAGAAGPAPEASGGGVVEGVIPRQPSLADAASTPGRATYV
jgi:hypothetical protein